MVNSDGAIQADRTGEVAFTCHDAALSTVPT